MSLRKEFGSRMESKLSSDAKLDEKNPENEISTNPLETEKSGNLANEEEIVEKPIEENTTTNNEENNDDKQTE